MHPDLFNIGPLAFHTYGLFVCVGFITALLVTAKMAETSGTTPHQVLDMALLIVLCAIIGSRTMYILLNLTYYINNPLDMFKFWEGGLGFSGGLVVSLLAITWYIKRHRLSFWGTADLWAPAAALGQGIGRIGCFMAGCCYGKSTDLPWGIIFSHPKSLAPLHVPLHPTQIYSALTGFIIFLVLMWLRARKQFEGQVTLWFLILHSSARLLVERFRGDPRGMVPGTDMSVTQLVSLLILLSSVLGLYLMKARNREGRYTN
ncbi:MAG: prolipoprotein diacylglyceryl transferase [Desulfatiglandales bacterium]